VTLCVAVAACGAPGRAASSEAERAAAAAAVTALADSILAAARARDADRFAAYFEPGEELVYVLNTTTRLSSQAALRDAFRGLLARQRAFDPRWADRRVQVLSPGAAVFTGAFRTTARDTSGAPWGARGVVTFAARRGAAGWRVVNWHTSESDAAP
jgi:ketosteroid isomerase-like protein